MGGTLYRLKAVADERMDSSQKNASSHAWFILAALTVVLVGFYGTQLCFGVFLKPILEEFGWMRATVSGAMSIMAGLGGLLGIVAGRLTDKYGARVLIGGGALLCGLGYILASSMSSLWQFYLYFGFIVGIGFAGAWTPVNATISRWFPEKRVLALGITTGGISVGNMVVPPVAALFITAFGWRFAYIMLAIILCITVIPALLVLGRKSLRGTGSQYHSTGKVSAVKERATVPVQARDWTAGEAAKTLQFWMLMILGYVTATGFYFLVVHIVAYATDRGIATTSAALILTVMGCFNILGKLVFPPLVDRIGSRFTLLLLLAMQAFALFSLIQATSLWMFYLLGAVFGLGFSATSPIRTAIVAEFFGLKAVGLMIGLVEIAWATGAISGPYLAGYVFDVSGSYDIAFMAGGLFMVIGMMAAYFLRAPSGRLDARADG